MTKSSGISRSGSRNSSKDNYGEENWVGFCPYCSNLDECKYPQQCVNFTNHQEGVLCRNFGWENYCKCAGFEDKCYKCYHENVDNYLKEMQAARAPIEVVLERRWARSKKAEREQEAENKKNWKVMRTGTCTPCKIVGLFDDKWDECNMPFILDKNYERWEVLGQW